MNEYLDVTIYPVQAYLTSDGIQYGEEVDTEKADKEVTLFEHSFDPPFHGTILWAYFLIGASFKSSVNHNDVVRWWAQARTVKRNWINLFRTSNVYVKDTHWKSARMEGYARASQENFNRVRFDFRVLFKCGTLNGAIGKIENNTMFRVIWLAEEAAS